MNWSGKCEGLGGGDRRGALCTWFTLVEIVSTNYNGLLGEHFVVAISELRDG